MTPPLPLDEAQARLLESVTPLGSEWVPVTQANGRYLSEPLTARRTQPAADLSAMDGYAVRAEDCAGPWRIIGESAAGHPFAGQLSSGEAVRISTGAQMPAGGGAVLLQENARREGETLALNGEGEPTARHIRRAGFDFASGDELLRRGLAIGPAQLALALAGGHDALSVGRRPSVAIIDSGDELAADPTNPGPHRIPASNGAMLAAMARPLSEDARRIGPIPDRLEDLLAAFEEAGEADVIVTSGGASVGDHDLVRPALERYGAGIDFWRIAMRPGKPLLVARKGTQTVLGLPGNPVSSYVTAFLFLLPLLRRLAGADSALPLPIPLALGGDLPATKSRVTFVRAQLTPTGVEPFQQQDSSALFTLASANALIRREAHAPSTQTGETVMTYLLQNGGIA